MRNLIKRIITQISLRNIKLFILYTKDYGLKYTLQLMVTFFAERELFPNFINNYITNATYHKWIIKNEPSKNSPLSIA